MKNDIPKIKQIKGILEDESECIEFLQQHELIYKEYECYQCGKLMTKQNKMWICNKKSCRKTQSILLNSFFEQHKLPLNELIEIYYLWLCKVTPLSMTLITGHLPQTITNCTTRIRDLISEKVLETQTKIGGQDIIVEIDESLFGRTKYHREKPV